ncbi:MAG: hypothetical protein CMO80_21895 [Verrucomicrobiales bacterium]|nr:hypothetical protein [Verrucomicrobiales bacterium]|tara:strand:+ start:4607 stop:5170 length:564 start_codon:yes stop_codon:yes gene_type:complete
MSESAAIWVDISTLVPWDENPRINHAVISKVAESIRRFGFASPIIARKADNMIIAGHTRFAAAQELGLDRIPVRFMDLDPADAKLLALADNKIAEFADWDHDALKNILKEVSEDDLPIIGFDDFTNGDFFDLDFDENPMGEIEDKSQESTKTSVYKIEIPNDFEQIMDFKQALTSLVQRFNLHYFVS